MPASRARRRWRFGERGSAGLGFRIRDGRIIQIKLGYLLRLCWSVALEIPPFVGRILLSIAEGIVDWNSYLAYPLNLKPETV